MQYKRREGRMQGEKAEVLLSKGQTVGQPCGKLGMMISKRHSPGRRHYPT